ncbi:MAG: hypothetical protein IMZ61_04070, partial [Planctomycetes bacterium]|nr:hypothetical protein [Planctomycetota bacterium]
MDFIKKTSSRVLAGILQSFRYDRVFFLALLVTMLVAYSLQVSSLGFYWDDWQAIFLSRLGRPIDYWNFYLSDRPFSAWIYILSVPLLGMSPLPWQIYTLLLRFLSVLGFYWAFTGLWPQRTWQVRWMALLLAVFPGFLQQPISVAYSQHFMTYALLTLSLAGMVWGQRQPRYFWVLTPLALLGCLVHAFTMEYFLGLELLRPVFLWILVYRQDEKKRQTVLKVLKLWTPYLIILTSFMIWRIFIFPGLLSGPDRNSLDLLTQLAAAPFSTALGIIETAWQNFVYLTLLVWANAIPDSINLQSRAVLFSWVIGLGTA